MFLYLFPIDLNPDRGPNAESLTYSDHVQCANDMLLLFTKITILIFK